MKYRFYPFLFWFLFIPFKRGFKDKKRTHSRCEYLVEKWNYWNYYEPDGNVFFRSFKTKKNIVISVLGYEKKSLKGSEISDSVFKTNPLTIRDFVILNKNNPKQIEIGDIKMQFSIVWQRTKKWKVFPYQPSYNKTKFIKEVTIFTDSRIDDAIKLHFYVDENDLAKNY